ncbi:MAG: hypothetical protein FJ403_19525 [Verrucomicrobia bacterium]|nr:hypothetical protein [Verrucomicrobiota bacterium]
MMKISLTPHQQKFIARKMKTGGYLSQDEVIREALRVYELVEDEDHGLELEEALRASLRSSKKLTRGITLPIWPRTAGKKRPVEQDRDSCPAPGGFGRAWLLRVPERTKSRECPQLFGDGRSDC